MKEKNKQFKIPSFFFPVVSFPPLIWKEPETTFI